MNELPLLAALTREQIAEALRDYVLARAGIPQPGGAALIDYSYVGGELAGAAVYVSKPVVKGAPSSG